MIDTPPVVKVRGDKPDGGVITALVTSTPRVAVAAFPALSVNESVIVAEPVPRGNTYVADAPCHLGSSVLVLDLAAGSVAAMWNPRWVEVAIREAGSRDAGPAAQLYLRARKVAAAIGTIPPSVHSDADVQEWMNDVVTRREIWIAELRDRSIVGLLVLDGDWIDQLYVDPDFTRRGIGSQLVEVAKRERPHALRLWTFASNRGAQRFYQRHGFAEVERTDGSRNEERSSDIQYAYEPDKQ